MALKSALGPVQQGLTQLLQTGLGALAGGLGRGGATSSGLLNITGGSVISTEGTADLSIHFAAGSYGTDGAGRMSWSLNLAGANVQSGLYVLQPADVLSNDGDALNQGDEILLNKDGADIVGTAGGIERLRISIDASGTTTFNGRMQPALMGMRSSTMTRKT